jgi:hypothetical protein
MMNEVQAVPTQTFYLPKKVGFSHTVEALETAKKNRETQKEVVGLLQQATLKGSSGIPEALELIDSAIQKVQDNFTEHSFAYNKLMAKCLAQRCIRMSVEDRKPVLQKAHELDPSNEKYGYRGLPF